MCPIVAKFNLVNNPNANIYRLGVGVHFKCVIETISRVFVESRAISRRCFGFLHAVEGDDLGDGHTCRVYG